MKQHGRPTVPLRPAGSLAARISPAAVTVVLTLLLAAPGVAKSDGDPVNLASDVASRTSAYREEPPDTLWIFDADFEDHLGDNRGWQTYDMSGGVAPGDYWHKDTIRIRHFTHLGDSTWWCGTYNSWWRQPRGYGNNWRQWLYRYVPLGDWSDPGDEVTFEWDQRFALENDYDYGYVDFSEDTGATWTTLAVVANNGFAGTPGMSQDWDSTNPAFGGHVVLDLSEFAGEGIVVRFRVESDGAYSSQDQYNNPPANSVLDGAWQLDNFCFKVNDGVVWLDDCESPGENDWIHHSAPLEEGVGITFRRLFEPDTFRGNTCNAGTGWMMAAVDSVTGRIANGQDAVLMTPPISTQGAVGVVLDCYMWWDFAPGWWDYTSWGVARSDTSEGLDEHAYYQYIYAPYYLWYPSMYGVLEGPGWTRWKTDISGHATAKDWISIRWRVHNNDPVPVEDHTAGFFLDRARIGITLDEDPRTFWNQDPADRWHDVFLVSEIEGRNSYIVVTDRDGLAHVRMVATDDGGATWQDHELDTWGSEGRWHNEPPAQFLVPGTQVYYYYEASDSLGNVSTFPAGAPDEAFEFSFLPINGSVEDPATLVVDKRRRKTPGDDRRYAHETEYYVTEALDILGYEYDVFDAVSGFDAGEYEYYQTAARGPEQAAAYQCYDTHIWLMGDMVRWTLEDDTDQPNLVNWLSGSTPESPRRLFLCGNNIGWDLVEMGNDEVGFFPDWLEASYEDYHAGAHLRSDVPDTMIRVRDAGLGLMTHDGGECWLRCACPDLQFVDVVGPTPDGGAVTALEYVNGLGEIRPAGVAKVDSVLGYRLVYLPFGIELMNGGLDGSGYYSNGIEDRVDLIGNIMEFLQKPPVGTPTGVDDAEAFANRLDHARPNPFNPTTTIEFSLAAEGHATIRVFDASGRVVRTLLDSQVEAGPHTTVWDGTTDTGDRAASGVYFVRMEAGTAAGVFRESRKVVLLK